MLSKVTKILLKWQIILLSVDLFSLYHIFMTCNIQKEILKYCIHIHMRYNQIMFMLSCQCMHFSDVQKYDLFLAREHCS